MFERSCFFAFGANLFLVILVDFWVFKILCVIDVFFYSFNVAGGLRSHVCDSRRRFYDKIGNGEDHEIACFQFCFISLAKISIFHVSGDVLRSVRFNSMQFEVKSEVNAGQFDAICGQI